MVLEKGILTTPSDSLKARHGQLSCTEDLFKSAELACLVVAARARFIGVNPLVDEVFLLHHQKFNLFQPFHDISANGRCSLVSMPAGKKMHRRLTV